jgi:hypothetical protein
MQLNKIKNGHKCKERLKLSMDCRGTCYNGSLREVEYDNDIGSSGQDWHTHDVPKSDPSWWR